MNLRKLTNDLIILLILVLMMAFVPTIVFAVNDQEIVTVEMRDKNLYEAIKRAGRNIGDSANDETKNYNVKYRIHDLEDIEELDLSNKNIEVIIGIEKFRNLKKLNISGNKIEDISFISNLKKLEELDLSGNRQDSSKGIADISAIEGLTNLKSLSIEKNSISDISALKNLTNLTYLNIADNKIKDVTDLEKLVNLEEINISKNKITDISCFENFGKLTIIRINNNEISDISPLKNLSIETLFLDENAIMDLSMVESKGINIGDSCKQNIKLTVGNREVKLPKIFVAAQDSGSKFYSDKPLNLYKGTLSTDRTKFIMSNNVDEASFAEVSIDSGFLKGSTLILKYKEGLVDEPQEDEEEPEEVFIKEPEEEENVVIAPKPVEKGPGLLELFVESAVSNWQFIIALALGGALLVVGVAILKSKKKKKKKKTETQNPDEQKEEPKDNIKVVKF